MHKKVQTAHPCTANSASYVTYMIYRCTQRFKTEAVQGARIFLIGCLSYSIAGEYLVNRVGERHQSDHGIYPNTGA